jgi:hypothetical protein
MTFSKLSDSLLQDGMNELQHIPEDRYGPVLATLNPPPHILVDKSKIQGRWNYDHPVIDDKVETIHRVTHLIF